MEPSSGLSVVEQKRASALHTPTNCTSAAWHFFRKYSDPQIPGGEDFALCAICLKAKGDITQCEVKYGSKGRTSTSKLVRHLCKDEQHNVQWTAYQAELANKEADMKKKSSVLPFMIFQKEERVRRATVEWIVKDFVPLDTCESESFHTLMSAAYPEYKPISREFIVTQICAHHPMPPILQIFQSAPQPQSDQPSDEHAQ